MEWIGYSFTKTLEILPDIPRWSMGIILGTGFVTYYLYGAVKQPILACSAGRFRDFLEAHVPAVTEKFWPTVWCFESRAQTVLASVIRQHMLPDIDYRRELLPLRDGGELALDWLEIECEQDAPLVLVIPGLTGNSQAEYIKSLMRAAQQQGFHCAVLNNRGLGGIELKTPRTYCAANYEDLMEVLDHLQKCKPNVPLMAVGISMGGLQLGNYLAEMGEKAKEKLIASMIISAPWDVFKATESIEQFGLNRLLNWHLAATTLHNKLEKIRVPTLCLSAADDPFQPLHAIPLEAAHQSEHVAILVTARGGHIGWMEGILPLGHEQQYMSRLFAQFVEAMTKQTL
ncbi:hypothetical protein B566_EDAN002226 [Ephemera danica]|nr:hypothetical protein B566_EDAN002226 [Ephemera danica]